MSYEDILESVKVGEDTLVRYKKLFFTALFHWRDRLGIDDPEELLGARGGGVVIEIDAFYFGINKKAAGVNP